VFLIGSGREALCWYETPANMAEFQNMFGHFEPM
jgi:hypothetical protein